MNIQEVIRKMYEEGLNCKPLKCASQYDKGYGNGIAFAINLLDKLDEPEKPEVPQYVADWYEENKDDFEYNLYRLCIDFYGRKLHEDLHEWFDNDKNKPIEVLVLMNKFGYEVEKEKLYTVELPNPNGDGYSKLYLSKNKDGKVELFQWSDYTSIDFADDWKLLKNAQLTEDEIKKDFEWAWQFAEEVEND